jgi:hypothetical protein
LSDDHRRVLANDYVFDYNEPVREYSSNEVPRRLNATLWTYCVQSLAGVFFTMPLKIVFDDSSTVDTDTRFDPTASSAVDATKYLHGMDRAIERILDKAKLHSPTYWSHVHLSMPSDSVWCEARSSRQQLRKKNATYPARWNDLDFATQSIAAQNVDELLYVGRLGADCAYGLVREDGTCSVPPGLCDRVVENSSRWRSICNPPRTYSTVSDVLLVRLTLHHHSDLLRDCEGAGNNS